MIIRGVFRDGQFSWKHHDVFLSETLMGERIGLQAIDDRWYTIYFAQFPLGQFDSRTRTVHRWLSAAGFYKLMQGKRNRWSAPHAQNPDQNLSTVSSV
jgi:hypothetical protein